MNYNIAYVLNLKPLSKNDVFFVFTYNLNNIYKFIIKKIILI